MKKFFMFLCIVIMFFGIVGCPSDDPAPLSKSSIASTPVTTTGGDITGGGILATPEPATLILLGSGLVGLAGLGRKRFKK